MTIEEALKKRSKLILSSLPIKATERMYKAMKADLPSKKE